MQCFLGPREFKFVKTKRNKELFISNFKLLFITATWAYKDKNKTNNKTQKAPSGLSRALPFCVDVGVDAPFFLK